MSSTGAHVSAYRIDDILLELHDALPAFIRLLDSRRVLEQRRTLVTVMRTRLEALDAAVEKHHVSIGTEGEVWPWAIDLVDVPDVAMLVQLHEAIEIGQGSLDAMIPGYLQKWKAARESTLVTLLGHTTIGVSASAAIHTLGSHCTPTRASRTRSAAPPASPLSSPAAMFWCTDCEKVIGGVTAMTHRCCYGSAVNWDTLHPYTSPQVDGRYTRLVIEGVDMYERTCIVHGGGTLPWSPGNLRPCANVVQAVWAACGLNRNNSTIHMTTAMLDNVRLACTACSQCSRFMVAMDWRRAVG